MVEEHNGQFVKCKVEDFIATVVLDNPPVNAISAEVQDELVDAFEWLGEREDVRVAVFTGQGRAFTAGADVRGLRRAAEGQTTAAERRWEIYSRNWYWVIKECPVPVIGAINGYALGIGLTLAVSCDILIASETAEFGVPEVNVGRVGGATRIFPYLPVSVVKFFAYTGQRITAQQALQWGMVFKVVPPDKLMEEATALAKVVAGKAPLLIRAMKEALNATQLMPTKEGALLELRVGNRMAKTEDAKEAVRAFTEKREPQFKGR